jgi:hypothetical protein
MLLQDPPRTWAKTLNPLLLLDYRCHVNEGAIGKDFPPALHTCMQFLASKTKQEIQVRGRGGVSVRSMGKAFLARADLCAAAHPPSSVLPMTNRGRWFR